MADSVDPENPEALADSARAISEPAHVFISYASQDAQAAERICDALRLVGIEVWFDKNELRGGEAWDASIRKQIKACALFIPIVSANTQRRAEGYFRREWNLAVHRTLDMAHDQPFLLPVAIDGTTEAEARVPEKFLDVQWTRLGSDDRPSALVERVTRLLNGSPPHLDEKAGTKNPASMPDTATRLDDTTSSARAAIDLSSPVPGFNGRPAIAVLAFDNISADPNHEYLADGLAEDILTRLATWRLLPVIARTSSFVFKGLRRDAREVGRLLGARYILEGSLRTSDKSLRVTAQLIDAETGFHVWAERYDRVLDDLFLLQDELTEGIVAALEDRVGRAEAARAKVKPPTSLDAWEALQRAVWHAYRMTPEDIKEAEAFCNRALELSPEMSQALSVLANIRRIAAIAAYSAPAVAMSEAEAYARRAVAADGEDAAACATLGIVAATSGKLEEGLAFGTRSIELNPSNPLGYHAKSIACLFLGDWQSGVDAIEMAIRINPADPAISAALTALSFNLMMKGDYERAADVGNLSVQRAPVFPTAWRVLASVLAHAGRIEQAARAYQAAITSAKATPSLADLTATLPFREQSMMDHFLDGLRKAGWKG
jgi:adenylate cyclase